MHRVLKVVLQRLYRSSNLPVEGRWTCNQKALAGQDEVGVAQELHGMLQ